MIDKKTSRLRRAKSARCSTLALGAQEQRKPMGIHHLYTEIQIDASADQVWAILSDFASYPQWNPFITSMVGAP